jgi:2-oxo-4-hydroxy-4-carboxy--5-ureidoimidazoline (OHCU) decarboxylase
MTLSELNSLEQSRFVETLGRVFEDAPSLVLTGACAVYPEAFGRHGHLATSFDRGWCPAVSGCTLKAESGLPQ